MIRIGIQGAQGSFSEWAAEQFVKEHRINDYSLNYLLTSEKVLAAVDSKQVDMGVLAIENAQGGVVLESIKALAKYRCNIIALFHVKISQNLLVLPETTTADITSIHSHPQALRQCREFLATHFKHSKLVEEEDTAGSAQKLQQGQLSKGSAVIANRNCAKIYDLELLQADINDLQDNVTLFASVKHYG